jgi:hypothetical protein
MPFGVKPDGRGGSVDFNAVYEQLLVPAIREAELEPLRADQELVGGLIHKPMFERLVLADYAIADLTTANANVFYELGVRHAARPYSTVLVSADVKRMPFDLAPDRVLPYSLDGQGRPADPAKDVNVLVQALRAARAAATDSPVFQLIDDMPTPEIDRLKTDVFREQAAYSAELKHRLAEARAAGADDVREVEREGSALRAEGYLDQAIDAYRRGFEADWRDAYPGVNAVTLMEIRDPGGDAQQQLLPVVRYANSRRLDSGGADYWDHATRLELGVIARDRDEATAGARAALAAVRESWEPESTAYNLSLIRDARATRRESIEWADAIERELLDAAGKR